MLHLVKPQSLLRVARCTGHEQAPLHRHQHARDLATAKLTPTMARPEMRRGAMPQGDMKACLSTLNPGPYTLDPQFSAGTGSRPGWPPSTLHSKC